MKQTSTESTRSFRIRMPLGVSCTYMMLLGLGRDQRLSQAAALHRQQELLPAESMLFVEAAGSFRQVVTIRPHGRQNLRPKNINIRSLALLLSSFSSPSPALFAVWLRSSVVSVLISLIAGIAPTELDHDCAHFCNLVGGPLSSLMADFHCVLGITLSPSDANHPLHCNRGLALDVEKKHPVSKTITLFLTLRMVGPQK